MPYRGGRRTKTRTHTKGAAGEAEAALALGAGERVPRSFVLRRGKVDGAVRQLVADVREMMQAIEDADASDAEGEGGEGGEEGGGAAAVPESVLDGAPRVGTRAPVVVRGAVVEALDDDLRFGMIREAEVGDGTVSGLPLASHRIVGRTLQRTLVMRATQQGRRNIFSHTHKSISRLFPTER